MRSPRSLDVVEDTVRREFGAQERRADAADTRAGLLLGFAGLIVSLGAGDGWPPLALTARVLAATAGLVALRALSVTVVTGVDVSLLHECVGDEPVRTRLALLDTDLNHFRAARVRLHAKLARVRLASGLVTAAVASAVLAATVEFAGR